MKHPFALCCLLLSIISIAQTPIEPCKFGQPLIDALQSDYTPSNPLGYGPARDILYSEIDNNGLDLSCIYTNFTVTLVAGQDPSTSAFQGGAGLNAEHVYPQSQGAGDEPAKSDLHNIFPSKVNVNESRGSCPYNEITDSDTEKWFYLNTQLSSIPTSGIDNYSEKDEEDCAFEPRESVKGDIARAVFYFYAIYQTIADAASPNFFSLQKSVLYQWHQADPPDATETQRNNRIASEQGNHNPFILDTSLVRRAYFEADASYPLGDPNCYSVIPIGINTSQNMDNLSLASHVVHNEIIIYGEQFAGTLALYNLHGQLLKTQALNGETRMSVNNLNQGIYFLHIHAQGTVKSFRLYKS